MGIFDSSSSASTRTDNINTTTTVGASEGSIAANSGGSISVIDGGAFKFAEKALANSQRVTELALGSNQKISEVMASAGKDQFGAAISAISGATQTNDDRIVTVAKWSIGAFVTYKLAQAVGAI